MVRARRVRTDGDDGEVDAVVALGQQPSPDVCGHLGLGAADQRDLAGLQLRGDHVRRRAAARNAATSAASFTHAEGAHDLARLDVGAGHLRLEVDDEAGPRAVADGSVPRRRHEAATSATGSSVSFQGRGVRTRRGASTTRGA